MLKTLDGPEVGRDVSTAEWREILEEVATAVANRLSCLDDESAQSLSLPEPLLLNAPQTVWAPHEGLGMGTDCGHVANSRYRYIGRFVASKRGREKTKRKRESEKKEEARLKSSLQYPTIREDK